MYNEKKRDSSKFGKVCSFSVEKRGCVDQKNKFNFNRKKASNIEKNNYTPVMNFFGTGAVKEDSLW